MLNKYQNTIMNIKHYQQAHSRGFTLIELIITLAIAGILAGLAIPSFSYLLNSNAIRSQTNHFTAAINLARSEAVKRNVQVHICKRSGTSCNNSGQWEDGWIIFADLDGDESLDSGEEIRVIDALRNNYSLTPTPSSLNWLAFQSDGRAQQNGGGFAGATFRLCPPDADTTISRTITLNTVGRVRLSQGTTACP